MKHCLSKTKFYISSILIFGFSVMLFAGAYEGTIGKYPIWISIDTDAPDGAIKGSYFYCKTGTDIRLEGTKIGDSLTLSEYDPKGKETGKFLCVIKGKDLSGTWSNKKKNLPVKAQNNDPEKMKDVQLDAQLDLYDQQLLDAEFPKDECNRPDIAYYLRSRYVRSLQLWAENDCGAYPTSESDNKVYDVSTKKSIKFWNEIDPGMLNEAKAYLQVETQKKLKECRAGYPDSEWVEMFKSSYYAEKSGIYEEDLDNDPVNSLDRIFTLKNAVEIMTDFYIDPEGAHLGHLHLFEFPHVEQAMDFYGYVVFGPEQLKKFLKEDSILRKVFN